MAVHVAENDVIPGPVQDDAQVEVHPRRPEARVSGASHAVQAEAWKGDVGLQIESGGLRRPLLVIGQLGEACCEGVGYSELHNLTLIRQLFFFECFDYAHQPNVVPQ